MPVIYFFALVFLHKLNINFDFFPVTSNWVEEKKIGDQTHNANDSEVSFEEAKKITYELVNESVLSRSVSDVPIGTFLSGGVDSSIISFCLASQQSKPINTFSLGFEKKSFDETHKSRLVAKMLGSKHHEYIISPI